MAGSQEQYSQEYSAIASSTMVALPLSDHGEYPNESKLPHSSVRDMFVRKGKRKIGVIESLRAIVTSSCEPNSSGCRMKPKNSLC